VTSQEIARPNSPTGMSWLVSLTLFVGIASVITFLARDRALVWDEGMTLQRLDLLDDGLSRLQAGEIPFDTFAAQYWRFSRTEPDGHGPFYALLSWAGHRATRWILPLPLAYRMGSILLFSIACTLLERSLRPHFSPLARLSAVAFMVTMPRLLPEVSFALIDGPLASLAMIAFATFLRAVDTGSTRWALCFGIAIGTAMATKLTGWFFVAPYLAWLASTFFDRTRSWKFSQVVAAALVIPATVILWNVGWWPNLAEGVRGYFESNLTRRETIPIPILFLGTRYDFSLPWYNTIVWTLLAVPVGILTLGLVGLVAIILSIRTDSLGRLLFFNWLLLIVLRALPQAPGHDGTRQIIVSFVFLAILAGWGVQRLGQWTTGRRFGAVIAPLLVLSALGESVTAIVRYHPLELSYYSPSMGGLPGADKRGMEPTYFWDSVTADVRQWLRRNTPPGESVLFRNYTPSWTYLHAWGEIPEYFSPGSSPPRWFVLQHRPGQYDLVDAKLMADMKPAFQKSLLGVPLLSIYDINDWRKVRASLPPPSAEPSP
jgi:hypothetical protein